MLELKHIAKDYPAGNMTVHALKGVDLRFRTSEFVSILGPSGCGKTTLLNIIGGLDQYTSGDLIIDGISTKDYKDRDWDTYRNHSIGFVFQTYNLIPHQTVLKNVELALTLAGIPIAERRERAAKALERVGLGDQLNKRPNQMSGGQMQRVAIARALVNNPDIILADEPTGALDTETGLQVMELLKEVAQDRLVIMVTHNPELATAYSSRIIRILDGVIVGDTAPMSEEEYLAEKTAEIAKRQQESGEVTDGESTADVAQSEQATKTSPKSTKKDKKIAKKRKIKKKSSMSLWTAFKLSLTNLFTKKGRTFLTSFAGSIGIIGIALILSVSAGMTEYINLVQEQTLSTYPLTIQSTAMDLSSLVMSMMSNTNNKDDRDPESVYQRDVVDRIAKLIDATAHTKNDLNAFKAFLEEEVAKKGSALNGAIAGLQYQYDLDLLVYTKKPTGEIQKADPGELVREVIMGVLGSDAQASLGGYYSSMTNFQMNIWQELLASPDGKSYVNDLLYDQYDMVYGEWPKKDNQVVLIMNENNEISDIALYTLGLIGDEYVDKIVNSFNGDVQEDDENEDKHWKYNDIVGTEVVVILNSSVYQYNEITDEWEDWREDPIKLSALYADGFKLEICGIIRPNPDATAHMLNGTIGYTSGLVKYVVNQAKNSAVVEAQERNKDTDILTGLPFETSKDNLTNSQKKDAFLKNFAEMDAEGKLKAYAQTQYVENAAFIEAGVNQMLAAATLDDLLKMIAQYMPGTDIETIRKMLPSDEQQAKAAIIVQAKPLILSGVKQKTIEDTMSAVVNTYPDETERVAYIESQLANCTDEQYGKYYDEVTEFSASTLEENLTLMGKIDLDTPTAINIYASSFEAKDVIAAEIARYNKEIVNGDESKQIAYTDFVAIVMSAVTTIIDAITYVLIAFVSISLIVSSIMIGVITLISVQERTKEIGILRAIGASKRDVSSMFNAETVIIGFAAGVIGVLFTYILCIPINAILHVLTGISTLSAYLPFPAALILIAISMLLTLISGLIPSRSAAKKDPVVALRTE